MNPASLAASAAVTAAVDPDGEVAERLASISQAIASSVTANGDLGAVRTALGKGFDRFEVYRLGELRPWDAPEPPAAERALAESIKAEIADEPENALTPFEAGAEWIIFPVPEPTIIEGVEGLEAVYPLVFQEPLDLAANTDHDVLAT